jgi:hypothetical protein
MYSLFCPKQSVVGIDHYRIRILIQILNLLYISMYLDNWQRYLKTKNYTFSFYDFIMDPSCCLYKHYFLYTWRANRWKRLCGTVDPLCWRHLLSTRSHPWTKILESPVQSSFPSSGSMISHCVRRISVQVRRWIVTTRQMMKLLIVL